jgi:RND family efflux transporter MFP subunit
MPDTLSSDLASLKIDRGPNGGRAARPDRGGPLRVLIWLAVIGGLGFLAYTQGQKYVEQKFLKPEVETTEISLVSPAQASVELTSTGYVVPQIKSQVGAKVPGRVAKVFVREGDEVKAGQVLLELERTDQVAAMQSARMRAAAARARVVTARAAVQEIQTQAKRQKVLVEHGAAASAVVEDLDARIASLSEQVRAAEAEVAAADAEVSALKVSLDNMTVVAPIAGRVLDKPPEPGELVGTEFAAGQGRTIELADMKSIVVETDVAEARLHMVKMGSPCEIVLDAYPSKRYRGEAVEIMPRVNRAKATVGVKVKFIDDTAGVLPDMSARVSFLTQAIDEKALQEKPKVVVPASALVDRAGAKVVFVVEGETVHMRSISIGAAFGDGFEVTSGPDAGTKVVKSPAATLTDGQKVKERTPS